MLGEWVRAGLRQANMTQSDLARELTSQLGRTVDRATVNKMISEKRGLGADEFLAITRVLKIDPPPEKHPKIAAAKEDMLSYRDNGQTLSVPVFGRPEAPCGYRVMFSGDDCVEWTFSPPGLEGVQGVYAAYVHATDMLPRYRPGEMVWVSAHKPIKRGDDVLVKFRDAADGKIIGIVREFVEWRDNQVILAAHNPAFQDRLASDQVVTIHPIVFCSRV